MRKLAIAVLLGSLLIGCGVPAYARRHRHVNPVARAAQKRNKARAKQLKRDARDRQNERRQQAQH